MACLISTDTLLLTFPSFFLLYMGKVFKVWLHVKVPSKDTLVHNLKCQECDFMFDLQIQNGVYK